MIDKHDEVLLMNKKITPIMMKNIKKRSFEK